MTGAAFVAAVVLLVVAFIVFEAWHAHKREQARRWS